MSKKSRANKAAALAAAEPTPATTTTTATKAKAAKAVDPGVAEAQAELKAAKERAKLAEAKAKEQRKVEREAKAAAAKLAKANRQTRPTCTATKKDGTACTAKAKEGSTVCVDHQAAWDRLTHEEHVAFGKWLRTARGPEIVAELGWFRAKAIAKQQASVSVAEQERTRPGSDNPAAIQERIDRAVA